MDSHGHTKEDHDACRRTVQAVTGADMGGAEGEAEWGGQQERYRQCAAGCRPPGRAGGRRARTVQDEYQGDGDHGHDRPPPCVPGVLRPGPQPQRPAQTPDQAPGDKQREVDVRSRKIRTRAVATMRGAVRQTGRCVLT